MYSKSQKTKKTSVNLFITTLISLGLLTSSVSLAKSDDDDTKDSYPKNRECRDYRSDLEKIDGEISKLCKDAGAGSGCSEKVDACSDEAGSTGNINMYSTAAQALGTSGGTLGTVLGAMGQSSTATSNSCPQYTYQDYFTKKDKYTDDLDKTEEDLAQLSDDKAQVQEDFNKEITDLQEDLNKAQEDLEQKKRDIAEKKRKATSDFQEVQNKVKDDLRSQSTTLLDLHGKLISSQRDKALNLVALTEASAKRACLKAVQDMKAQWQKDGTLSGLTSGTMISKAKRLKEDLINTWNDCMTVYDQKRQALLETKKQEEDAIRKQIQDTTESMAQTQDTLDSAQSQLTEITNEATTEQSQAEANLTKLMQNIQTKMTAAKQKLEQKLQTIATKTTTYQEKINRLNASITQLGVAPPSGTTTTRSEIADELQTKETAKKRIESYIADSCGGSGTSSSSKTSGSGRQ